MVTRFSGTMCFVVFLLASVLAADEVPRPDHDHQAIASRVLTITDVVLDRHIDPPTRQQMVLSGTKAVYRAAQRPVSKQLTRQVSELAGRDQIGDYIEQICLEFRDLESLEDALTGGVLLSLPGGSALISGDASRIENQVMLNRYVGIGIALTLDATKRFAQVGRVFYGGAAWRVGMQSGDLILEVDGKPMVEKTLEHVVEALRGEEGSSMAVVVRQPDSAEKRALSMVRSRVMIPTVEGVTEDPDGRWRFTFDTAKDIAVLRIKSIGPSTLHELRRCAEEIRQLDVRGIVLDLRRGSGILHDVVMTADAILDGGTIGHVQTWDAAITHEARAGDLFDGIPMAVLVGKSTSAGNVFLAAALQDNGRAVVVGQPTTGETYVSEMVPVPGGSDTLRLATGVMLRGDRTPLLPWRRSALVVSRFDRPTSPEEEPRLGFVKPDVFVPMDERPLENVSRPPQEPDTAMAKAMELLQVGSRQQAATSDHTAESKT